MVARSILARRLRQAHFQNVARRSLSTSPLLHQKAAPATPQTPPSPPPKPEPKRSWIEQKLRQSPTAKKLLFNVASVLGFNSPKQIAGRRAYMMYEELCVRKAEEDSAFWQDGCDLPPTFQSWFSVTNLHIWMLTVRFRALPDPIGKYYIQALVDHFFLDVEDRIRQVLQPATPPKNAPPEPAPQSTYTVPTTFYTIANADKRPKGKAPERLVTRQMKILKEQWAGLGMAFDLGLIRGDAEMASAVWRNFLGARGARGIVYPSSPEARGDKPYYRRSVNLVGGEVEKVAKIDKIGLEVEEARDDGSGVHDFAPDEADKYVKYPELMADIVQYVHRELARLEKIPTDQIVKGGKDAVLLLRFGQVRE
ncbi:CBP3-like protein [Phanerochaete sordida]|uniref:CBP3-like protein n=1 Tax=Phanerochaete sordida TaxID=48140 RepID=A0A9P3LJS2_9APHY|nr:CBP3-like protein [Phanerochaete sordida]